MSPNIEFKLKNLTETINRIHFATIPRKEYMKILKMPFKISRVARN